MDGGRGGGNGDGRRCGEVAALVAGHNDPAAWLGGEPDAWASADLRGLREDATYASTMQCSLTGSSTEPTSSFVRALAGLPCKDELKASEHVDVWFRHHEQEPPAALLVFRAVEAGASCLEAGATRTALSPTVTESVRPGARWARSYVVRGAHGTWVLMPDGAAYARTRGALATGVEPPFSEGLAKGILARLGTLGDPGQVLGAKLPSIAMLDLRGLNRAELTVDASPGKVAASVRMKFNFPADADRLEPVVTRMSEEFRLRAQAVTVGRTDSGRSSCASARTPCLGAPSPRRPPRAHRPRPRRSTERPSSATAASTRDVTALHAPQVHRQRCCELRH